MVCRLHLEWRSYCQTTFFKQSLLQHDSIMLFPPLPWTRASPRSRSNPIFFTPKERNENHLKPPSLSTFGCLPWLPVAHAHTHRQELIFPLRSSQSLHGQGPLVFFPFGTRKRESSLTCSVVIPARTVKSSINNRTIPSRLWTKPEPGIVVSIERPIAALTLTGSVPLQGQPNGLDPPCREEP